MCHMDLTPPPASLELLDQLLQRRRGLRVFAPTTATRTQVLQQLAPLRTPALVPHLAVFGLVADSEERSQADAIVSSILDELDVRALLEFDRCVRDRIRMSANRCAPWTTLQAWDLTALRSPDGAASALIGALSCHASGHVREAAVRLLDEIETGAELRYLLVRLNDWVPAVRSVAQQAVQRRFRSGYAAAFARNIDLIDRLLHWERVDHTVLLRWIVEYLRGPDGVQAVKAALDSIDVRQRRLLYGLLLSTDRESSGMLVRRALRDTDPVCRLRGIRMASSRFSSDALREVLHHALRDSFSAVRLVAARALAAGLVEAQENTFVALLMDAAPSVRIVARHRLRQAGWTDFVSHYARQLAEGSRLGVCVALRAIGEVGDAASVALVRPYASVADSRVAAIALRTLAILDGDAHVDLFLAALRTGAPGLVREAARAIAARIRLVDLHTLWSYNLELPWGPARGRILSLLFGAPKWEALGYMLASLRDPHADVADFARGHLDRWLDRFNQSSLPLSAALKERLRGALQEANLVLRPVTVRELEFILR
jgi:hypothetical protein